MLQPIILHSHARGPNPLKVSIVLEELGVQYESKIVATEDLKKEPFEKLNPNGRYRPPRPKEIDRPCSH